MLDIIIATINLDDSSSGGKGKLDLQYLGKPTMAAT